MNVVSCRADIKYTPHRLVLFHQEGFVGLLSDAVVNDLGPQRIRARLLMLNLHPYWTKLVDFGSISKLELLDRPFPILFFWRHSHPSLRF